MKTNYKVLVEIILAITLAALLVSCSSTKKSGFLDDYYKNMTSGPKGGAEQRWLKPGVDFSKYDKVMLDSVVFYLAKDSEDKGIDSVQMNELASTFNRDIVNALKDKYPNLLFTLPSSFTSLEILENQVFSKFPGGTP